MLSISVLVLGYRVYARDAGVSNISMSSPAMAPTLAGEMAGTDVACQAGDLSCDMGGRTPCHSCHLIPFNIFYFVLTYKMNMHL